MKRVVFIALVLLFSISSFSTSLQVTMPNDDIKSLFDKGYYQEVVDQHASQPRSLSADELAYVAESYLHLNDMLNASMYADLSVQKNAKCARAYYVKGTVQSINGSTDQALASFKKAADASPNYADAYTGMGDIYYGQDNISLAEQNYKKAMSSNPPSEKAYYMIGAIYAGQDDMKNALEAFYIAKNKIVKDKELLVTVLYNIGKMEFDFGRYTKAVEAYEELIENMPDDYYSYEKLVQCNNALGLYDQANSYKSRLYNAYKAGQLVSGSISNNFCIDQFQVGGNDVFAYERYEEPSNQSIIKNIFYVMNKEGEVESSVSMEYIPSTEVAKGEYKFTMTKGENHYTFDKTFPDNVSYSTIRPYVEDIITGKVQPSSN
ncbi:MAG: tetratricopeptide repeat protein [Prevotella sp.]|nr:tetratricopeptide repeat protein [Prevotella sp.]